MSIDKLIIQLKELEKKRRAILQAFSENSPLAVGTVTQTKGRCGKPNCICTKKPIHEITLFQSKVDGKQTSQLIRKADVEKILTFWTKYKNLKKLMIKLKEYDKEELYILKELIQCRKISYKPQ